MHSKVMKKFPTLLVTFIVAFVFGCATKQPATNNYVSVKDLVDGGQRYNNKFVGVSGYISYGFESCILTPDDPDKLSRDELLNYIVWYWDEGCMTQAKNFRHGHATLYGTYELQDKGHLGSFNSSIVVDRITWE